MSDESYEQSLADDIKMTKLSKEENDKLQTALVRDRLAGLRMERGDFAGAREALRDAPEPPTTPIILSLLPNPPH